MMDDKSFILQYNSVVETAITFSLVQLHAVLNITG